MIGLNHKTAPVEVREALAVPAAAMDAALARFHALPLREAVLLSTCNRTEIYAVSGDPEDPFAVLTDYLTGLAKELHGVHLEAADLDRHLYRREGMATVEYLFRVAAGLESMVLGETQILGQVRDAYQDAIRAGTVGKVLHQLFHQAITAGKRAHTETRIGQSAVSVSYAAVELARKVFRSLSGRKCLAIGAGETAKLTVKHLQACGVREIIVANRTLERAESLAQAFGGRAVGLHRVREYLAEVDLVISSTGSPGYVVRKEDVVAAMRERRGRPIFFFDIAVPRDLDPAIGEIEGAFLYDIDDLQSVVNANLAERAEEAKQVERILAEEVKKFRSWVATQEVVPTIRLLREKLEEIREKEVARALARMPDLTERERAIIEAMSVTLINKILNAPTQQLKGMADEGAAQGAIEIAARLFELPRPEAEPVPRLDTPSAPACGRAVPNPAT